MEFGQVAQTASGKPFKPIAADDEHVLHTTVSEICAYSSPETRSFGVSDPQAYNALDAIHIDTDSHITGLVDHAVTVLIVSVLISTPMMEAR